jgi:anti-anti-sigma regulatory factor
MTAREPRRSGAAVMTIQTKTDGVSITVQGQLDDMSGRALRDAVEAALVADGRVVVDLEGSDGFSSQAIRELAACAHRGALLRFHAGGAPPSTV